MKLETLKTLIKQVEVDSEIGSVIKARKDIIDKVLILIELYEQDTPTSPPSQILGTFKPSGDNNNVSVPYFEICSCKKDPSNGGDGICDCILNNKSVPKTGGPQQLNG